MDLGYSIEDYWVVPSRSFAAETDSAAVGIGFVADTDWAGQSLAVRSRSDSVQYYAFRINCLYCDRFGSLVSDT